MTNYITKRIQVIFRCVFEGILAYLVSGPKNNNKLVFPGLLLVLVEIMPDKFILDHKESYLVYFENFHFCDFFTYGQFLLKIEKNENF